MRSVHAQPDSEESSTGFRARLEGAQLSDLIQLQCGTRGRSVIEVHWASGLGRLFFDAGQLVHAKAGSQVGLDAVVTMLRSSSGRVYPARCEWPSEVTIGMSADAVLLQAAYRMDTEPPEPNTLVSSLPSALDDPFSSVAHRPSEARSKRAEPTTGIVRRVAPPTTPPALVTRDWEAIEASVTTLSAVPVVRVSAGGNTQVLNNGASAALADSVYFCQEAADRLGRLLGCGPCRSLGSIGEERSLLMLRGEATVGAVGATEALAGVARRMGL